MTIGMVRTGH